MQVVTIDIWTAEGNRGGSLKLDKYELVKAFIVEHLREKIESSFSDLLEEGKIKLSGKFPEPELSYLLVKVKGDLEARGIIRKQWQLGRVQVLRLKKGHFKTIQVHRTLG